MRKQLCWPIIADSDTLNARNLHSNTAPKFVNNWRRHATYRYDVSTGFHAFQFLVNVHHFTNLFHVPQFSWDVAQQVLLHHPQTPILVVFLVNLYFASGCQVCFKSFYWFLRSNIKALILKILNTWARKGYLVCRGILHANCLPLSHIWVRRIHLDTQQPS